MLGTWVFMSSSTSQVAYANHVSHPTPLNEASYPFTLAPAPTALARPLHKGDSRSDADAWRVCSIFKLSHIFCCWHCGFVKGKGRLFGRPAATLVQWTP
jgi:hypothetical protein